jgi:hypothetical protein
VLLMSVMSYFSMSGFVARLDPRSLPGFKTLQEPEKPTLSGTSGCVQAGIAALGARGDFQRHYSASIGVIDGQIAGRFALDGEPGNQPKWRL